MLVLFIYIKNTQLEKNPPKLHNNKLAKIPHQKNLKNLKPRRKREKKKEKKGKNPIKNINKVIFCCFHLQLKW